MVNFVERRYLLSGGGGGRSKERIFLIKKNKNIKSLTRQNEKFENMKKEEKEKNKQ